MDGVAPYLSSSSSSSSLRILKRKEVDEVSDDFSDFSLSAPARKTRRLVLVLFHSLSISLLKKKNSRFLEKIFINFVVCVGFVLGC
jgi:hypothetical protein